MKTYDIWTRLHQNDGGNRYTYCVKDSNLKTLYRFCIYEVKYRFKVKRS